MTSNRPPRPTGLEPERYLDVLSCLHRLYANLNSTIDDHRADPRWLAGPTWCADWNVGQVISHLGSGAELMLLITESQFNGTPLADDFREQVWRKFDALDGWAIVDEFRAQNERYFEFFDNLTARTILGRQVKGHRASMSLATWAATRLEEFAIHCWDIDVAADPDASIDLGAAALIVPTVVNRAPHLARGPLDALGGRRRCIDLGTDQVEFSVPEGHLRVRFAPEPMAHTAPSLSNDEFIRLIWGRLRPGELDDRERIEHIRDLLPLFPGF